MNTIKILILLLIANNAVIGFLLLKQIECLKSILYDVEAALKKLYWKDKESYQQSSPYDVSAVVEVSAAVFGGQGTLALEFVRPVDQIRTAFISEAEMIRFIDGLYVAADQRIKLAEEELTDLAVNTAIAYDVDNNKVRNLLTEFNALLPEDADPLTAAQAVRDADFLRYACMEIGQTIDYMGEKGRE